MKNALKFLLSQGNNNTDSKMIVASTVGVSRLRVLTLSMDNSCIDSDAKVAMQLHQCRLH